jgi:glycosyl transferase, family 25
VLSGEERCGMIADEGTDIKVFIINLKGSVGRKAHMVKQLDRLNIPYEFLDATDGQELSDHEIRTKYGVDTFPPWHSLNARHLTKGEIGCLLSHLRIYKRMVDEGIDCACIFEDDNDFGQDMDSLLTGGILRKFDWELLLLGHSGVYHYRDTRRGAKCASEQKYVSSHYHITKPLEAPFGTFAYMIRKSAAQKLLRHAYPLRMPMDYLTGHAAAIGVQLYVLSPPCTTHNRTLFESTVCDRDRGGYRYFDKLRKIKGRLGDRYPVLKTLRKMCFLFYWRSMLRIGKAGLLEDSYADKQFF